MMWIYLIILTIAITGFFAAAMGLKLVFEKDSSFHETSCGVDTTTLGDNLACSHCKIKEIVKCDEKAVLDQKLKIT